VKTHEIRPLTSLRFIAALMVFLHHFYAPAYQLAFQRNATFGEAIIIEGHIGVTIFFVLSGFLITLRYFLESEPRSWTFREYIFRRIARIWPLYYFLLIITLLLAHQPLLSSESLIYWSLSQGFFMNYWSGGVPTAWSLTVEEAFYLLAPLIFVIYLQLRKNVFFRQLSPLVSWAILLITLNVIFEQSGYALRTLSQMGGLAAAGGFMRDDGIMYTTIFFRFFEFGIGIWCAYLYSIHLKNNLWEKSISKWIAIGLLVMGIAGIAGM